MSIDRMLSAFNSQKFRFWAFVSMVLLVFVHGYNLDLNYLQPWTLPGEPLSFTTFTEYWLANGLFRFRIPMLFIISGYLFAMGDSKPYKERTGKRVKTLLYPYLIWSAIALILTYVLEFFYFGKNIIIATRMMQIDNTRTLLHQYHWYEVLARWIFFPASYQLWFIRVLFFYNLAYPALRWCVTHRIAKWIFFSFAVLAWLATVGIVFVEGEGLLFFSLGIWMQKTNFDIDKPGKWLQPVYWFIVFVALSVVKTLLAFLPHFNGIEHILLLCHKIVVISGLIVAWYGGNAMVKYCMGKAWFVQLTAFSFMIYVLHAPLVLYATKAIFLYIDHYPGYRLVTFIVLPLCIIIFSIGFGYLLRRYLPAIYSIVTGGRGL
ncbi:acyltransferase [Ferruginibacter lapsinanis]|uniref:acyltransferase family protein n=1 Tax=Ferruginibacter lapsinanis TaxID=563172 RepID=UPI001E3F8059|nr:acyltransferase [Ferruginibacter lapsinanis]UEG50711.1 acyltransferase [Ferruginibacter lapsinanis]